MNQKLFTINANDESEKKKIRNEKSGELEKTITVKNIQIKNPSNESQAKSNTISNDATNSLKNSPVMKILNNKENIRSNDDDELKIILDLIKNSNDSKSSSDNKIKLKNKSNIKDDININGEKQNNYEIKSNKQNISESVSKQSIANDNLTKEDLKKFKDIEIKEIMKQMNDIKTKLSSVIEQSNERKIDSESAKFNKSSSNKKHRTSKTQTKKSKSMKKVKDITKSESNSGNKIDPISNIFKL